MKSKDVIYFHIVIALFFLILSVYSSNFIFDKVSKGDFFNNSTLILNNKNPGMLFFFKNNISFFLLVSIVPFFNCILFILQFISLGISIQSILHLPLKYQFVFLYRHLFFEIIALFTAIIISYKLFQYSKYLLNDKNVDWKKKGKKIVILYLILIISTLIGAILEGTVNVGI